MDKMIKSVRILQVIGSMNRGGAETMIMNLYRNMDRNRIQFDFVEHSDKEAAFDEEIRQLGGNIYRCPRYNVKNHFQYKSWWKTFFKTHSDEYQIIHGHIGSTAAIYLGIARRYGLHTIAHSHNTSKLGIKDILFHIYAYPTRYVAENFLACSKAAGISRYGKRICDTTRFFVLNNAIDSYKFKYDHLVRKKIRNEYHIKEDTLVIGNVSRFAEQKNHLFLLDIFANIHRVQSNSILMLVGDGPLRSKILEKAKKLKVEDKIIFTGVQENVQDYYQAFDTFVFPSLYEGLGIVVVEAQSAGLKCIISDTIPDECIVTKNQVTKVSLKKSAKAWAEIVLSNKSTVRAGKYVEVMTANYDISVTSKWLEDFYLGLL